MARSFDDHHQQSNNFSTKRRLRRKEVVIYQDKRVSSVVLVVNTTPSIPALIQNECTYPKWCTYEHFAVPLDELQTQCLL